ncbi:MAG: Panacea domain-containing protein [Beijerinckiaceae bacterium]
MSNMRNDRLGSLLHWIIASLRPAELGAIKLNRIAWLADRDHFIRTGRTITGREYIKLEQGPVPAGVEEELEHLRRSGAISERKLKVVDYSRREFESLTLPDASVFATDERDVIEEVIEFVRAKSAAEISEISHDEIWVELELGETISMTRAAAAAFLKPIDEHALNWARRIEKN